MRWLTPASKLLRAALRLSWPVLPPALCYALTLSPGLSWANLGADSGDLLAALALDTLPHPPGYPAWLLLLEGWLLLPWPDVPRAAALASVLATVIALLIWHDLLRRRLPDGPWAGLAVLWLGLQPLLWSQAVIVEVYAAGLSAAVLFWAVLERAAAVPTRRTADFLLGVMLGLASGLHLTLLALACSLPALRQQALRRIPALGGGLTLGAAVWLLLPLRGAATTAVGWGAPTDAAGLVWMVSGAIYREAVFALDGAALAARAAAWASGGWGLFVLPALPLVVFGLAERTSGAVRRRWILLPAGVIALFALGYGRGDALVLLIVPLTALSLLLADGLARAARMLGPQRAGCVAAGLLLLIALQLPLAWPQVDAAQADEARRFAERTLAAAPPGALLYSSDDRSAFALNYLHHVEGLRPDLILVTTPLLRYDWYQHRLAASYPGLQLPGPLPSGWEALLARRNPRHPLCYVDAAADPALLCRSSAP